MAIISTECQRLPASFISIACQELPVGFISTELSGVSDGFYFNRMPEASGGVLAGFFIKNLTERKSGDRIEKVSFHVRTNVCTRKT